MSIAVISVHVLDDAGCNVGKGVRLRTIIFRSGDPAHHAEATHVVNVHHVHAIEGEILEVHPIFAIGVVFQIELAGFRHFSFGYGHNLSEQCYSGRTKRITAGVRLSHEKTSALVRQQANEGSGTGGCSLAALGPACFLTDIVAFPQSFERPSGSIPISEVSLKKLTRGDLSVQKEDFQLEVGLFRRALEACDSERGWYTPFNPAA